MHRRRRRAPPAPRSERPALMHELRARVDVVRGAVAQSPPAAHVRARVVRPAVQRRALGARHDRGRGRRLRARAERASGRAGSSGTRSDAADPHVAVFMPCGYDVRPGGRRRARASLDVPALGTAPSTSSRPTRTRCSPARARGSSTALEALAWALHPRAFRAPPRRQRSSRCADAETQRELSGCRWRR